MIGIQNSIVSNSCRKPSFTGDKSERHFIDVSKIDPNSLDERSRNALDELRNYQNEFDNYADKFSNSDSKAGKKAGKVIKFMSGALGLAAVFILAKGGFKASIETAKSFVKSDSIQGILKHVKGAEPIASDAGKAISKGLKSVWELPKVQSCVKFVTDSAIGKRTAKFLKSEKGKALTEPLKNAWNIVKNPSQYSTKIQSVVENTAAGITTGSVAINKIAGQDNKELVSDINEVEEI